MAKLLGKGITMLSVERAAPVRRKRLSAEQRRETIVNAAVEVFAAAGYRAGKVSDVAARIGVSEPVIFQNFGSKAALFAAVLDRAAADIRAQLDTLSGDFGSASGLLAHLLSQSHAQRQHGPSHAERQHDPSHAEHTHRTRTHAALFADAVTLATEPGLTEPASRAVRAVADHLADLVRRGQADGDIRADADPEAAAWLLLSVLSARPWRAAAMPDPDRVEDGVTALALQALTAPEAGRAGG